MTDKQPKVYTLDDLETAYQSGFDGGYEAGWSAGMSSATEELSR